MAHLHIIYKVINKINKKFYIGYHKTKDLNDDYFGSGIVLKKAVEKYGKENFYKEILHIYTNEKEAFIKEKELVSKSLLESGTCYNLNEGGHGGFEAIRRMGKHNSCLNRKIIHNPVNNEMKKVLKEDLNNFLEKGWVLGFSKIHKKRLSLSGKIKIQSQEHRKKNSETKKNSVIMINIITKIKKFVKKHEIDEYINKGWQVYCINFKKVS